MTPTEPLNAALSSRSEDSKNFNKLLMDQVRVEHRSDVTVAIAYQGRFLRVQEVIPARKLSNSAPAIQRERVSKSAGNSQRTSWRQGYKNLKVREVTKRWQ